MGADQTKRDNLLDQFVMASTAIWWTADAAAFNVS